jgi:hypothetical protein
VCGARVRLARRPAAPARAGFFDNFGKSSAEKRDAEFRKQQASARGRAAGVRDIGRGLRKSGATRATSRRAARPLRSARRSPTLVLLRSAADARCGHAQEILKARRSGKSLSGVDERRKEVAKYMKLSKDEQRKFREKRSPAEPIVRSRLATPTIERSRTALPSAV